MKISLIILLCMFCIACANSSNLVAEDFFKTPESLQLISMVENSDTKGIKSFKENNGNINVQGLKGVSPLSWAILNDKTSSVNVLLDLGANVNYKTERGRTPLAGAAFKGDRALIDRLLLLGAEPNTEYSVSVNKPLFAEVLFDGDEETALYLLQNGADINYQLKLDQQTALMVFYRIGRWDLVYWLLNQGADPSIKDAFGYDLHKAIDKMIKENRNLNFFERKWFEKVRTYLAVSKTQ